MAKKEGKKTRKYGRNLKKCKVYKDRDTERRNKIRRLRRHLRRYPDDLCAEDRLVDLT